MSYASTPTRKISWRERREAANLLQVLATEQTRVAERLARFREAHALTQEAAAARAGVTLRAWQRWESGQSEPYARNLAKISEEFEIPLNELIGDEEPRSPSQLDRIEALLNRLADVLLEEAVRDVEELAPPAEEPKPKRESRRQQQP